MILENSIFGNLDCGNSENMKPARGPQTMVFVNDCCGIIVVQIGIGPGAGDRRSARNVCHVMLLEQLSRYLDHNIRS